MFRVNWCRVLIILTRQNEKRMHGKCKCYLLAIVSGKNNGRNDCVVVFFLATIHHLYWTDVDISGWILTDRGIAWSPQQSLHISLMLGRCVWWWPNIDLSCVVHDSSEHSVLWHIEAVSWLHLLKWGSDLTNRFTKRMGGWWLIN